MTDSAADGNGGINSVDYWNRRFFEDWIAKGGRRQTEFFAELCVRELPEWLATEVRERGLSVFDYGCALGDALPVWRREYPQSAISGGDVAQVGLGLARALYPDFAFADVGAFAAGQPIADLIYCSNTLEHFPEWRPLLDRLGGHAGAYIVIVVPFEEAEPIDEHAAIFEFDSLPPSLPSGLDLVHLAVVDAAAEPDSQWLGQQLIAVYRNAAAARRAAAQPSPTREQRGTAFDLRGLAPEAAGLLLRNLAAMSRDRRRCSAEATAARREAAELRELHAGAENRAATLDAGFRGALREYRDLVHGIEEAQRWVLGQLAAFDPDLLKARDIPPTIGDPPLGDELNQTGHRMIVGRLIAAVERANRLALTFRDQAGQWRDEREGLRRRLHDARRLLEGTAAERDRLRSPPAAPPPSAALVSIVLPVYNQAYLIDEAIAGVLAQTYPNWELIVVDDGSTDDIEVRLRRYLADRRVLLLRQPNQRLPAALNAGFAWARGELLTWTSADNAMLPRQLERLVGELAAHPEAGLVYSDYWAIDEAGEPLDDASWRPHNRDPEIADLIRLPDTVTVDNFHKSGDNFIGASFLYRRHAAEIVGNYADDAFGGEDYDFWLRMHLVTEFRHVAEPLYRYRVHADTLTARAEDLGLYDNIRELLEADRWRIETLLAGETLKSGRTLLRPPEQFHAALLKRRRVRSCAELAAPGEPPAEAPLIVDIDAPPRMIDPTLLRQADILLCRSPLTAALLRREPSASGKRILAWDGMPTPAVSHAYIQAFADQVTTPIIAPRRRTPARVDAAFRPSRILLMVDRWSSGGLENIVADLAARLAAEGAAVSLAAAHGATPRLDDAAIPTRSFAGDETAFATLLGNESIEIVNYHHSRFGVRTARERGVGTVYTMHNCYLWMDEAEREAVKSGLAEMDRVVAVSRQVAQFAAAEFAVPAGLIDVIPNGLRDRFLGAPERRPPQPGAPFTVAMVASLTRPKLQHVAIAAFTEAAAAVPAMRLRLIGVPLDQEYHRELQAQIAASPAGDRIELTPGIGRIETVAALAAAQVFLLPSLVEGCSMALLEAAAQGCICIATDVGAARDLRALGGSVVLLPSPLGELEGVTQRRFLDAARSSLPEHRANIADALREVWRDYGSFAAAAAELQARLPAHAGLAAMTDAYRTAYTLAYRGGGRQRHAASAVPVVASSG